MLAIVLHRLWIGDCEAALNQIWTDEDELEEAQQRLQDEMALIRSIWRTFTFEQAEVMTQSDWNRLYAGLAQWSAELGRDFVEITADIIVTGAKFAGKAVIAGAAVVGTAVVALTVGAIFGWLGDDGYDSD